MNSLLAIDLGVKTGLALFNDNGKLVWYRSHNYGNKRRLKNNIPEIFHSIPGLSILVIEGGGPIAELWKSRAVRHKLTTMQVFAEEWRKELFFDRQIRNGPMAKQNAIVMAKKVVTWSDIKKATAMRHDTAEAILVGLWGVLKAGWLSEIPTELK
ncbi:MAG: hypothetical protein K8S00_07350 [Bacteroidales bacterium]|nr:hypothetical protein [Bacteroidales bacterium]